ncbi:MAG: S9 family peptidase [Congregibacter sp.]
MLSLWRGEDSSARLLLTLHHVIQRPVLPTRFSIKVSILLLSLAQSVAAEKLTIERMFSGPGLDGSAPRALQYAPDGSRVTYLQARDDDFERYDLWEYHIEDAEARLLVDSQALVAGEEQLSDEEKARRERQRIFGKGIMEYVWADDSQSVLFPLAGDVYRFDLSSRESSQVTRSDAFETDVRSSPQGRYVSFIRDQNIFVVDLQSGEETQLTRDGGAHLKNGMAEFVAQEEMGRYTGYWWSPDERHIAYLQVDESPVDEVTRSEIYADRIDMITQRYPAAGRPNVLLKLAVLEVASGNTRWIDLGDESDIYIPRVKWASADKLSYQWQSRDQQRLELRLYDLASANTRTLLTETSDTWINLHKDLRFIRGGEAFIWASERSGYRHLYLYDTAKGLQHALTSGEWVVDGLAAVDEASQAVFFTGRKDTPLERHLYRVGLEEGDTPERISERAGMHSITFSDAVDGYIDHFSAPDTPPQVSLHAVTGERRTWVEENTVDESHPLAPYWDDFVQPEFGRLKAEKGRPDLYYRLYKPADLKAGGRYPVVVYVYGGPGAQFVSRRWDRLFPQYLAQHGYVVFSLDNRGSEARGKAFEDPIYRNMGDVEVQDQVAGVEFLRSLPFVDGERIGIYGHSYGGYMTLMALFKAGDYFSAGVSGAPVTDWLLYDTHYTERYMGHPDSAADDYMASSVFPYADALEDPLLLYHGMADDNVLFSHSTRLMKHLQDAGKQFELMTYPGKKHSLRGKATRMHQYQMITDFFDRHLRKADGG